MITSDCDNLDLSSKFDREFPALISNLLHQSDGALNSILVVAYCERTPISSYWYGCAEIIALLIKTKYDFFLSDSFSVGYETTGNFLSQLLISPNRSDQTHWANAFRKSAWPPFLIASLMLSGIPISGNGWDEPVVGEVTQTELAKQTTGRIIVAKKIMELQSSDIAMPLVHVLLPSSIADISCETLESTSALLSDYLAIPSTGIHKPVASVYPLVVRFANHRVCISRGILRVPELNLLKSPFSPISFSWYDISRHTPLHIILNLFHANEEFSVVKLPTTTTILKTEPVALCTPSSDLSILLSDTEKLSNFEKSVEQILSSENHIVVNNLHTEWSKVHNEFRRPIWRVEEAEHVAGLVDFCLDHLSESQQIIFTVFHPFVKMLESFSQGKGIEILPAGVFDNQVGTYTSMNNMQAAFIDGIEKYTCYLKRCGWSYPGYGSKSPVYVVSAGPKSAALALFEEMVAAITTPEHVLKKVIAVWAQASMENTVLEQVIRPIIDTLFTENVPLDQSINSIHKNLQVAAVSALQAQSGISLDFLSTQNDGRFHPDICANVHGSGTKGATIKRYLSPLVVDLNETIILKAKVELY
jgi:hypothetical protein